MLTEFRVLKSKGSVNLAKLKINLLYIMVEAKKIVTPPDSRKIWSPELLKGQVALVSGGSNGGMLQEMAKDFLLHGCVAVVLMSRKLDKLQAVAA